MSDESKKYCGIIMPISDVDDYPPGHWREVLSILGQAIEKAEMKPRLVSDTAEVTIIQKSIVKNLYFDEVAVCDVSSRNPNVMIELGMRLAFDKPVVVVKDELTDYPFDTSALEYVPYRSDLRFQSTVDFKEKLEYKIRATKNAHEEGRHESFLKTFGSFKFVQLEKEQVSTESLLMEELQQIKRLVTTRSFVAPSPSVLPRSLRENGYGFDKLSEASEFASNVRARYGSELNARIETRNPGLHIVTVNSGNIPFSKYEVAINTLFIDRGKERIE